MKMGGLRQQRMQILAKKLCRINFGVQFFYIKSCSDGCLKENHSCLFLHTKYSVKPILQKERHHVVSFFCQTLKFIYVKQGEASLI